jgi:cyclopropane-fatty-acyl-phospholipid synthase
METMRLSDMFTAFFDDDVPVGFRGFDGSSAGPRDPVALLEVRSPDALRHLVFAPGELGLVRAFVTGALEVHGDLHAACAGLLAHLRPGVKARRLLGFVPALGRRGLRPPPAPPEEAAPPWRRGLRAHSRQRDAAAIAHHYDVSNRFYELILGPSMTYSCAVFSSPESTLEEAQEEKVDLVCRKLALRPGDRLLDVGAGWGALVRHAANYGARALGVTLSREQARWAQRAIEQAGLGGRAEVRFLDWRDLRGHRFDAISSVGAMEHFGRAQLASHFSAMAAMLRPGGRMLNHCITRPSDDGLDRTGPFFDRYVFPDGELLPPSVILGAMHDNGFELRHEESLREHYAMTLREWAANLEGHWDEAVAEAGERRARAWRLYMAVSRLAFERNLLQIHQMLGVRVAADGASDMPLRPDWPPEAPLGRRLTAVRAEESRSPSGREGAARR